MIRLLVIVGLVATSLTPLVAADDDAVAAPWPAVEGQAYPDLALSRLDGSAMQMSSLAGKPLLIEYIGIPCAGCQAFLGGNRPGVGGFGGCQPQGGLEAVTDYLPRYGNGLAIDDERFTFVAIILYGTMTSAPTLADARAFAEHFALVAKPNHVVLFGDARYVSPATFALIPGFQVVDADFVLRSDATGHHPARNFWDHTFPLLAELVGQQR